MNRQRQFAQIEEEIRCLCDVADADRLFVVTDSNVDELTEGFLPGVPRVVVEAGERSKSLEGASEIWRFLIAGKAVRRSVVVNVGGGMVSDLGGFAASTFKRGLRYINAPTTLLAAVDASIGGKTGINFNGLKNEIGVFAMPFALFPLTSLFGSLSEDEWLSGAGEALKTGLLDSEDLFELVASEDFMVKRDVRVVEDVVKRCAAFKNRIVEEDFREKGKRRILNLGHTAGHAIEMWSLAHGHPVPHGIAVAHGLRFALEKSVRESSLPPQILNRYERVLKKYFPPLDMQPEDLLEAREYMAHDKKNTIPGTPSWVLLRNFGQAGD